MDATFDARARQLCSSRKYVTRTPFVPDSQIIYRSFVTASVTYMNRKLGAPGLENQVKRDTLYPQKLALTSPTSGGRSVGIVRLLTKAMDFFASCRSHETLTTE
jgi:hypothetical protein